MQLGEQEAAPVAEVRVVLAELVAVVAEREGPGQGAGQGLEGAEVGQPLVVRQAVQADAGGPALVAVAQDALREGGGVHRVVEGAAQAGVRRGGAEVRARGHGGPEV